MIKFKLFFTCILIFFSFLNLYAVKINDDNKLATDLYNSANELYRQGDYLNAAKKYEEIINMGIINPFVYYNLGNTYYRLSDIGNSIYYFEKARLISPFDRDINSNINIVKSVRKDKIEEKNFIFNFFTYATVKIMLYITSFCIFLFFILMSVNLYMKNGILKAINIILFSLLILLAISTFLVNQYVSQPEGVVINDNVSIYSGPGENYVVQFVVNSGLLFKVTNKENNWNGVIFENGMSGWINDENIKLITMK